MTDFSSAEIRLETAKDPAGMLSLAGHAGWNQTLSDCAVVTGSENSLAVYAFCGERLAGCAGCFLFGDHDLCHINMVVTHADFRRRGIAKRMVSFLMEMAACRTCRLYATQAGGLVYAKLGFVPLLGQKKYFAASSDFPAAEKLPSGVSPVGEGDLPELFDLDEAVFGFRREKIMRYLFSSRRELAFCHRNEAGKMDAFTLGRIGPAARNIMCSALDPAAGRELFFFSCTLKTPAEKLQTMIYDNNGTFRSELLKHGFAEGTAMNLMDRGEALALPSPGCFGIAGGEFG